MLRRDLVTGETERVTGGPGGAIAPRVSPDGRLLSFIRRDRLSTVLYLRDLATGREWPVWDGLERDMQEAWAIHGVYTTYDWTPDGRAIVIWAQGGFWNVPLPLSPGASAGAPSRIPFTAEVEQRVHEGLRYRVDVAPDTWRARMLRNVTTSPDGRTVAYDALGKIWIVEGDRPVFSAILRTPSPWSSAIRLAARSPFYAQSGLFAGRAGIIAYLAARTRQAVASPAEPDQRELATQIRRLSWHAMPYAGRLAFPGDQLLRLSMDLATGTAGVLLAAGAALHDAPVTLPFLTPLTAATEHPPAPLAGATEPPTRP